MSKFFLAFSLPNCMIIHVLCLDSDLTQCKSNLEKLQLQAKQLESQCNEQLKSSQNEFEKSETELKTSKTELTDLKNQITARDNSIVTLEGNVNTQQNEIIQLKSGLEEKTKKNQDNEDQINELKKQTDQREGKIQELNNHLSGLEYELQKSENLVQEKTSNAKDLDKEIKKLEKELEKEKNLVSTKTSEFDTSKKQLADTASELLEEKKNVDKLKSNAKESQSKLSKLEKDLKASKKEVTQLKKQIKDLGSEVDAVNERLQQTSNGVFADYMAKSSVLVGLLYNNFVVDVFPSMQTVDEKLHFFRTMFTVIYRSLSQDVIQYYNQFLSIALQVFNDNIYPVFVLVKKEFNLFYHKNISSHVADIWKSVEDMNVHQPVLKAYTDTKKTVVQTYGQLQRLFNQYFGATMAAIRMISMITPLMIPAATVFVRELYTIIVSEMESNMPRQFWDWKNLMFEPLSVDILSERFVFQNGLWDLQMYSLITLLVGYFLVYRIGIKVLLFTFNFFFVNFFYRFLLKTILGKCIIGLSFSLLKFSLNTAIFLLKLAMCCGCCGVCFRRNSSLNGVKDMKVKGSMSQPDKTKLQAVAAAQAASKQKKKK